MFNKIPLTFWKDHHFSSFLNASLEARIIGFYLLTSQHSNLLGVYYLPLEYIACDTHLPLEATKKALHELMALEFCDYDKIHQYIWVCDAAKLQLGELKPSDKQIIAIHKLYTTLPQLSFLEHFYQRYADKLHLRQLDPPSKGDACPITSPSEDSNIVEHQTHQGNKEDKYMPLPQSTCLSAENMPLARGIDAPSKHIDINTDKDKDKDRNNILFVEQARPNAKKRALSTVINSEKKDSTQQAILTVFTHWQQTLGHPSAKLDAKRKRLIQAALKMGYQVEDLCSAISGCAKTPHNLGQNDRGQRYDGLHIILRDADQIDRFRHNDRHPPKVLNAAETRIQENQQAAVAFLNQSGESQ